MYARRIRFKKDYTGRETEITPGPPRAVALGYEAEKDPAPRVLASGKGVIAAQIIALARDNGIPIREDPLLAASLAQVDIDAAIPPELYALVAELLAFVYRIRQAR